MTGGMPGCSAIVCMGPVCQVRAPIPMNSSLQRFRTTSPTGWVENLLAIAIGEMEEHRMPTRKSHTVWRHYLEAWGDKRGFVHYSRKGKILPPADPRNVMVIRDTYRLPRITETDLLFLQQYIVRGTHSAELRAAHWNLVQNLARISSAYEFLRGVGTASADDLEQMKALVLSQTGNVRQVFCQKVMLSLEGKLCCVRCGGHGSGKV